MKTITITAHLADDFNPGDETQLRNIVLSTLKGKGLPTSPAERLWFEV